jgi:hypothetical protein
MWDDGQHALKSALSELILKSWGTLFAIDASPLAWDFFDLRTEVSLASAALMTRVRLGAFDLPLFLCDPAALPLSF